MDGTTNNRRLTELRAGEARVLNITCTEGHTKVFLDADRNVMRVERWGLDLGFIPPVVRQAIDALAEPVDD